MFGSTALETSSNHRSPRDHRAAASSRKTSEPRSVGNATLEIAALIIIAILLVTALLITRQTTPASLDFSDRLKVRSGDSLWTLATAHPVEGLSTAQLADLLAEANGLSGRALIPGQVIRMPRANSEAQVASRY
jgi:Tfp pilus assembly protein FimV